MNVARHSVLLSNTWTTCPEDWDNPGKLGIIPDRPMDLEWFLAEMLWRLRMGLRPIRVVVGVTYLLAYDGYGL